MRKETIYALTKVYMDLSVKFDRQAIELIKKGEITEAEKEQKRIAGSKREVLRGRVNALNKKRRINDVLDLATNSLHTLSSDFDNDPHELNLLNGVYNFKDDTFSNHSPENLFFKQAQVEFNPQADEPKYWLLFLRRIFDDDHELIAFIQRCVGYSLTGLTDLQALLFCYGSGANGKSTFFAALRLLAHAYYCTLPIEVLLTKVKSNTDEYQLSKLKGARLVVADEIPKGRRLQESMVKNLTGGDLISARNPFERPFEFAPTHTLWLYGNHKPVIQGTDHGIWRRVHLIPFTVRIPDDEKRDMDELLKEFEGEMSGILNWALDGYRDYSKNGLQAPHAVLDATKEYRDESDSIGIFLDECCVQKPYANCQVKALFSTYSKWCEDNSETPILKNSRQLTASLRERNFEVKHGAKGMMFVHELGLKSDGN